MSKQAERWGRNRSWPKHGADGLYDQGGEASSACLGEINQKFNGKATGGSSNNWTIVVPYRQSRARSEHHKLDHKRPVCYATQHLEMKLADVADILVLIEVLVQGTIFSPLCTLSPPDRGTPVFLDALDVGFTYTVHA